MIRSTRSLFLILFIGFLVSGCVGNRFSDTVQPQSSVYLPVDVPIGQTFIAQHAGLNGVELSLAPQSAGGAVPVLHLRADIATQDDLATARADNPVNNKTTARFSFPPQADSHGKRYFFLVEGADVLIGVSETDNYPDGALVQNNLPQAGDVAFATDYSSWAIAVDLLRFGLGLMGMILVALFLFVLPGLALTRWSLPGHSLHWAEGLGVACGLSLALYPLLFLWSRSLGLTLGEWLAWLPGVVGGLYLLWAERASLAAFPRRLWAWFGAAHLPDWTLAALLLLLTVVRLLPIRTLPAPMWGDSVHHTMIVQLLVDNGGLFDSWTPYAPLHTMTYHFGFHTAAAVWAWVTNTDAPHAVLITGQMLNVLAVLALLPLTLRLTESRLTGSRGTGRLCWAGVVAVLVAGFLSQMPGYYLNWGRYTQLAGQVILPVLVWAFDVWLTEKTRPKPRFLLLVALLTVGLALTHYRVATVAAAAGIAWVLWAFWLWRKSPGEWLRRVGGLVGVALVAPLLIAPWILIVQRGQLSNTFSTVVTRDIDTTTAFRTELQAWSDFGKYYTTYLSAGALIAWVVALWKRRELAIPLALFAPIVFLMTNPFLVGLPGTGWITNFLLVIGAYVPLSILLGWLAAWAIDKLKQMPQVSYALVLLVLPVALAGARTQLRLVDRAAHQMVTQADIAAFRWVSANTPADAHFLVNGFLAYNNSIAVGSDAGWWLPFYTQRSNNIPPMPHANEATTPQASKINVRQLLSDIQASTGDANQLHAVLCRAGLTHVYLGQRQGQVGYGSQPLVPSATLQADSAFTLLHQEDQAQVWRFEREELCTGS